jgi:hypothetical protein
VQILLGTVAAVWERRNIAHGMQGLSFVCVVFSMGPQVLSSDFLHGQPTRPQSPSQPCQVKMLLFLLPAADCPIHGF